MENVKDSLSVFDAEPNPFVTGGVSDSEKRRGVAVASIGEAFGELENREPIDRDASEFHANPHRQPGRNLPHRASLQTQSNESVVSRTASSYAPTVAQRSFYPCG